MKFLSDFFNGFLGFLSLQDEQSSQRNNIKRNRVFHDFSDDDETTGTCPLSKKFRWSELASVDNHDKMDNHSRSVRIVPIRRTSSPYTSTPQMSFKRTIPVDLPCLYRNPSPPPRSTPVKPITDADLQLRDSNVAKLESTPESKRNKPNILHVDLDEDENDEVVFVKEVATPRMTHAQARNNHDSDVKDKFLSSLSKAKKSDELLQRIENSIMSKEKTFDDSTQTGDIAQKAQITVHDNERHQNAPQEGETMEVSLSDSEDDDVEIVPPARTTTSSVKTNTTKKIEELSKNWLLELDNIYKTKHQNNHDNNVSREQNKVCSQGRDETDGSNHLLAKLGSTYNIRELHNKPKIQKTQENHNDSRRASDVTPNGNSEQNEAGSSKRETIGDWLAKMDAKYFRTPRKTLDKLDVHRESNNIPKVSEQNEAHSQKTRDARDRLLKLEIKNKNHLQKLHETSDTLQVDIDQKKPHASPLESTKEWLKTLEAKYFPTPGNLSKVCRESDVVTKINSKENDVRSINLNNSRVSPLRKESEYETHSLRKQENYVRESDTPKANKEKNEARSYLPAASRDWLAQLEAQYETQPQNNQVSLNIARQKLSNISKENGEHSEIRSVKLDSTDDWLADLRAKYNKVQSNRLQERNDATRAFSNEKHITSHQTDTTEEIPSLTSKDKTEHRNIQRNPKKTCQEVNDLTKVDSEQKATCSFKFNTSEELMSKLGCLYDKYHEETDNKSDKSIEESDVDTQSHVLPVLTPEQEEMINEAFEPEPEEELLVERFNMRIHRRDIQTLADLNWLNDEVINFYMNLIMQRSEDRKDLPRVYATNTFFYPKLMQSGQPGLRRWTRKVDIFAYELFMVPVNIGHHWCLSIVDFRGRVIKYLDSQGLPNQECLDALLRYLMDEHRDKKGESFDANGWQMKCITGIPQQMNGSDCGMFACTFAEFTSRDAPYTFTQAHMPYLRRKAALEILTGKLLL